MWRVKPKWGYIKTEVTQNDLGAEFHQVIPYAPAQQTVQSVVFKCQKFDEYGMQMTNPLTVDNAVAIVWLSQRKHFILIDKRIIFIDV